LNIKERINHQIQAKELRVILEDGQNLGVLSKEDALDKARELGLDLIEISPGANPPIAKIMDYGKFEYTLSKKLKAQKAKARTVELKSIQIKVGTGDHDLELKAKQITGWLKDGDRVKINLFLPGRTKFLNESFLNERLERLLKFIATDYKIADPAKKNPKGLGVILEKSK
jgi:translation initiation factor IF-3